MTKLQFAESVAATCKRPAAYTLRGTLPEVIANLDGFAQGIGLQHGSHSGIGGSFECFRRPGLLKGVPADAAF